jgi:hypothetical protein
MRKARQTLIARLGVAGTFLSGLLAAVLAWAADADPPGAAAAREPEKPNLAETIAATSPAREPLNLLLTQSELRSLVREYERETGEVLTAPIDDDDEVLVTAPGVRAPMRDPSQDIWPAIAAPFWAIANPKHAWRIFVPIPPKGDQPEAEPMRAEDRFY